MEPESSGKRSSNQLQGAALQDQAIRPDAAKSRIVASKGSTAKLDQAYRVIIRYEDHTIRGLAEVCELGSIEELLLNGGQYSLGSIRLKRLDTEAVEEIPTKDAKAVFFVKTFDGDERHNALHFHENAPITPGLWVRVHFNDDEMIEGIISNSRDFVLEDGFFLVPTDPNGNNKLVYVQKRGLKDFHILGMRNLPKTLLTR